MAAERRRGLGRGLGALIGGAPSAADSPGGEGTDEEPPVSRETSTENSTRRDPQPRDVASRPGASTEADHASSGRDERSGPEDTAITSSVDASPKRSASPQTDTNDKLYRLNTRASRSADAGSRRRPVDFFFTTTADRTQELSPRDHEKRAAFDTESNDESEPGNHDYEEADTDGSKRSSSANTRVAMPDVLSKKARTTKAKPSQNGSSRSKSEPVDAEEQKQSDEAVSVSRETVSRQDAKLKNSEEREGGEGEEESLVDVPGAKFGVIPVDRIHPNRKQPRQVFDQEELDELATSIEQVGLLQPVVIRPSSEEGDRPYELVMGERRWRATQAAGEATIPAIIRDTSDADLLRDALLENLHRSQLNPLEEAAAYQQLMTEFECTQDELSERIGRSRPQISNTIRLLRLPPLVQRRVAAGVLSSGHARALLSLSSQDNMEKLAQRIVNEGLSVRATEEHAQILENRGEGTTKRRAPEPRRQERLDFYANQLQDRLETNVKITLGARKGKVQIDFASVDDLNRIMSLISDETGQGDG